MTSLNDEFDEFMKKQREDVMYLKERSLRANNLLKLAIPYIVYHYERSQVGFGKASKELIDAINKFLEG